MTGETGRAGGPAGLGGLCGAGVAVGAAGGGLSVRGG